MYSHLPNLIIGFHGCDQDTYENVLYKHERLRASHNSYDWLGNGIYFWENSLDRASEWAESYCERYNKKHSGEKQKQPAVIERIHEYNKQSHLREYDSVRGVFIEGNSVYENSGIMEKTHTQLCIINPNCIKGYFKPLTPDSNWSIV